MQIIVSGQHIHVANSLQEYATNRVMQITTKYFPDAISATVHFSKDASNFVCDIVINDGTGRHTLLKANSRCDDMYSAFDIAISRVEKQLRKYKSKLKDHHNKVKISDATKYIISPTIYEDDVEIDDTPVIIAEKPLEILTLSVSQAVMKMDLENLPALMFSNNQTNRINIIYYRKDGNISWIESL